jgi:hypothetical protein
MSLNNMVIILHIPLIKIVIYVYSLHRKKAPQSIRLKEISMLTYVEKLQLFIRLECTIDRLAL